MSNTRTHTIFGARIFLFFVGALGGVALQIVVALVIYSCFVGVNGMKTCSVEGGLIYYVTCLFDPTVVRLDLRLSLQ